MAFLESHRINLLEGSAGSLDLESNSRTQRRHKQVKMRAQQQTFVCRRKTGESDLRLICRKKTFCHFSSSFFFLKMTWGQVRMSFIPPKASKREPFFPLIIYGLICTYPWTFDLQGKSARSIINLAEWAPNSTNCVFSAPIICTLS